VTHRFQVLLITAWYPTTRRPTDALFIREFAHAIQQYDDVIVMHAKPGATQNLGKLWTLNEINDDEITEGIPTYEVLHQAPLSQHSTYFFYPWSVLQACRQLSRRGIRPDLIHVHVHKAAVPAMVVSKFYRVPTVITEHSTYFSRQKLTNLHTLLTRITFHHADIVLPVSHALQHNIEAHGIRARFKVVPNIVDTTLFYLDTQKQFTNTTKRLLTIGTMDRSHKKGLPYLLKALAQLIEERRDWHLDIIGDGDARVEYETMVSTFDLQLNVTFWGFQNKSVVAEMMRQADLLIVPSLHETFSVVAAEALAAGVPVLATRCGGPEEFIGKEHGMLVDPGDEHALYQGLREILRNLEMYNHHEIAGYAAENFSRKVIGEAIHNIYEAIV
jgi:glycosyltransferase involved in cell wall biosynthesis